MVIAGMVSNLPSRSLKRRLILHYVAVISLTVLVLEVLCLFTIKHYYFNTIAQVLDNRVALTADFYSKYIAKNTSIEGAQLLLGSIDADEIALVEILDPEGQVILDSNGFVPNYRHSTPEVRAAQNGRQGAWLGNNPLTGERILAVATPLRQAENIVGLLRYSVSMERTYQVVYRLFAYAVSAGLLIIVIVLALCYPLARSILLPIEDLTQATQRFAAGDHSVRAQKRSDDEIGQLADTFNYMCTQIDAAERAKNEFISSISHELRTPLTSLKGWSETLYSGQLDDHTETRLGLQIICQETDRMIGLVEDLLDFSRLQTGRMQLNLNNVDINSIVTEVCQLLSIKTAERQVGMTLQLADNLPPVCGDGDRLKQVLLILLDNALKFTPTDGLISVSTMPAGPDIVITVADTGPGIAAQDLPLVKSKFYKGSSKLPGSGLGLSIADDIVQLHGGQLEVTSQPAGGTAVHVCLPIESEQPQR